MPPKTLPKKHLAGMKRRFRELIDWAFDGNLTLTSQILHMPFSTVQQYYQKGPRRISPQAIQRMDDLDEEADWGHWVMGQGAAGPTGKAPLSMAEFGYYTVQVMEDEDSYVYPAAVGWRVKRVANAAAKVIDCEYEQLLKLVFSPIIEGIKAGLYRSVFGGDGWFEPAIVGGRNALNKKLAGTKTVAGVGRLGALGFSIERARSIHRLCEFWEWELGIGAKP